MENKKNQDNIQISLSFTSDEIIELSKAYLVYTEFMKRLMTKFLPDDIAQQYKDEINKIGDEIGKKYKKNFVDGVLINKLTQDAIDKNPYVDIT